MRTRTKTQIGKLSVLAADDMTVPQSDTSVGETPLLTAKDGKIIEETSNLRWLALALCCLSYIGSFFSWGLIGNLQSDIMIQFNKKITDINLISSIASVPAVVFPFIGGILVDRFGIRRCYILGALITISGYVIVTIAIYYKEYSFIIVGVVIVVCGDSAFAICNNTMLVKWFAGKELSLALGVSLIFCRLGSMGSCYFSPEIYKKTKVLVDPFLVGLSINLFSFLATISLIYLDKKTDTNDEHEGDAAEKEVEPVGLKDIKKLNRIFFLVVANVGIMFTGYFGLMGNLNDILSERFNFSTQEAGKLVMIVYLMCIFITPTVGIFSDKRGKRVLIILISGIIYFVASLYIEFLSDPEEGEKGYAIIAGLIFVGIFFSAYSAVIWPCVALVVNEKLSGLAYAACSSFQAILGIVYPLVLGYIHDHTTYKKGYFWTQILISVIIGFGLILSILLYFMDIQTGRRLDGAGTGRKLTIRERIYSHTK